MTFSDAEWERFFTTEIASANTGIVDKTERIQTDHVRLLLRDDGTRKLAALAGDDVRFAALRKADRPE